MNKNNSKPPVCEYCGLKESEYIVPCYLCKPCWADFVVNEQNTLPNLTLEERAAWIKRLIESK